MDCIKQPNYQLVPPKPPWLVFIMENEYFLIVVLAAIFGWRHGGKVMRETREGKREGVRESESIVDFFFRE